MIVTWGNPSEQKGVQLCRMHSKVVDGAVVIEAAVDVAAPFSRPPGWRDTK
jgi:hypothetical protein